ncbi:hypothetical protein LSAT2_004991 [Lamellibrachia satsuma]|nr:hypothetical protein LSAT2_004991 [Lamellibrachia satsuma]
MKNILVALLAVTFVAVVRSASLNQNDINNKIRGCVEQCETDFDDCVLMCDNDLDFDPDIKVCEHTCFMLKRVSGPSLSDSSTCESSFRDLY